MIVDGTGPMDMNLDFLFAIPLSGVGQLASLVILRCPVIFIIRCVITSVIHLVQ